MNASVQVTPESAPELLKLLRRMAARGTVRVTAKGIGSSSNWSGSMTFQYGSIGGFQTIEGLGWGGILMPTPITPTGFTPRREGDAIARYQVAGNVVTITYRMLRGTGWRRFEFTAG